MLMPLGSGKWGVPECGVASVRSYAFLLKLGLSSCWCTNVLCPDRDPSLAGSRLLQTAAESVCGPHGPGSRTSEF